MGTRSSLYIYIIAELVKSTDKIVNSTIGEVIVVSVKSTDRIVKNTISKKHWYASKLVKVDKGYE